MALNCTEALAIATIQHSLPATTHRLLADWLDCYTYLPERDRVILPDIVFGLCEYYCRNSRMKGTVVFRVWLMCDIIQHLPMKSQIRILEWIQDQTF